MKINLYRNLTLFRDLDQIVEKKHSQFSPSYRRHKGNVYFKMNHLDVILYRCEKSFKLHHEYMQEAQEKLFPYKESADPEIHQAERKFMERGDLIRRSLVIDIESYIIFTNIVLDSLIWMISPFIQGHFTKNIPKTQSFGNFCDWVHKNQEDFNDKQFLKFMLDFRDWFQKNIRYPRNQLIVHKYGNYTQDTFTKKGIIRAKRSVSMKRTEAPTGYFEFDSPIQLNKKLHEYLSEFEKMFIDKLS